MLVDCLGFIDVGPEEKVERKEDFSGILCRPETFRLQDLCHGVITAFI
jgi:hypothetical protein